MSEFDTLFKKMINCDNDEDEEKCFNELLEHCKKENSLMDCIEEE